MTRAGAAAAVSTSARSSVAESASACCAGRSAARTAGGSGSLGSPAERPLSALSPYAGVIARASRSWVLPKLKAELEVARLYV